MNSAISHLTIELDKKIATALEMESPEDGIQLILEYLGKFYQADRSYLFEFHPMQTMSNTYEWCADDVQPQMDNLQNEPISQISYWIENFENGQPLIIDNIEDIRYKQPSTYAVLKPQEIHTLISVPFYSQNKIMGFLGLDNPTLNQPDSIVQALYYTGSIFSGLIKTRILLENKRYYEYHDPLTHFFNQNALKRDLENSDSYNSLGIIVCNISIFSESNGISNSDTADDYVLFEWNSILRHVFHQHRIYQISGESFVVICPNINCMEFTEKVSFLKDFTSRNSYHLAIGHFWSNTKPINVMDILNNAKRQMPRRNPYILSPIDRETSSKERILFKSEGMSCSLEKDQSSVLNNFIANNYFDLDSFFQSMSIGGLYPYFGDLTSDLWYISDSMRDLLGFQSNIVVDLLGKWEKFIPYKEDVELYRNDIESIMSLKKEIHDLIYRINDKDGNELWIRCFGLITWNKDRTTPLSFCGNVFRLNHAFIVDPITNLLREKPAIREIGKVLQTGDAVTFVCFRLNGFSEVNELNGRHVANSLLKDIGNKLLKSFDQSIQFYRLDGLRFLAIVPPSHASNSMDLISEIKTMVSTLYTNYGIPIRIPCSLGILQNVSQKSSAQEVMTDIMSVLEIAKNTPDEIIIHSPQTVHSHREKKQMVIDLSNDVANGFQNFRVLVQPIVSAETHKIVGGEILLRWSYEGQDVSPMVFIPILEETKLILPVGRWVFEQAAKYCKRINAYNPKFFLDFNVSYHQINDNQLLDFIKTTLEKWELASHHLIMELTETQYNNNPLKLQEFVDNCLAMGIQMALDDFGVGYSSLEMLLRYPARVVKLDRSLMKKMSDSKEISDFITSIVYACHKFGKLVCVEGVETKNELDIVTEAGCDFVQGFYFYRPMEVSEVYTLV